MACLRIEAGEQDPDTMLGYPFPEEEDEDEDDPDCICPGVDGFSSRCPVHGNHRASPDGGHPPKAFA